MSSAFCGNFSKEERSLALPKEWSAEEKPEIPNIPSSWKWEKGCDVFEVIRGLSYQKNDSRDSATEGFSPVLRANNIGKSINFSDLVYVRTEKIRDVQLVRRNDILIAMSSGSKRLVGKAAPIVTDFKGSFGAFCGIIRNKSGIQNEFLARYFQSPQYTSWVVAAGRGIGINNLRREDLDSIPIPAPPAEVQISIVAKVDELMALCDRLEAQLKERDIKQAALAKAALAKFTKDPTPENLQLLFHPSFSIEPEDLRKTILTLAVHGKLVPQNTNEKPAEGLLTGATISALGEDEIPFEIPNNWRWKKLGEIALIERGGSPRPIKDFITSDAKGLNWIKIGDTEKGGKFITSTEEKIRPDGLSKTRRVYPGDFLLTNSMSFGRPYITKIAGCIHDGWLRINPPKQIQQDYLYHLLSSPYAYSFFRSAAAGAVVQNLNADKVRELPIPIPPIGEQTRIKEEVEKLMALVDTLEAQLESSRITGEKLLEAMVAELTSA